MEQDGDSPPRSRLWLDLAVAGGFLLVVLVALAAAGYRPGEGQLGGSFRDLDWDHVDWNNHLWNLWDFRRVYLGIGSPLHSSSEFYPEGLRLVASQGDLLLKAMGGALALVFPPDTTFLLVGIFMLWGNALGGYLLGLTLTGNRLAGGVVCGLLLCFASPVAWAANTGNLEYGLWLWLCLYLVFLTRLLRGGHWRDVILAAVMGAVTVLGNYVFFFHLVLTSLILVAFHARSMRAGRVAAMVALSALLLLPLAWGFYQGGKEYNLSFSRPPAESELSHEARMPYKNRALARDYLPGPWERKREDAPLQVAALALAAAALLLSRRHREVLPWVVLSASFLVLSLGPYIAAGPGDSEGDGVPLPFLLFHRYVPLYHYIRFPHRMATFVALPLAAGAAVGAAWLARGAATRSGKITLALGLAGVVLLEAALTWPLQVTPRPRINSFYLLLGEQPRRFGLVVFPMDFGLLDARYLYYQTHHNKPLFNGVSPRYLGTSAIPHWDKVQKIPLLRAAYTLQASHLERQELSKFIPLDDTDEPLSRTRLKQSARELADLGLRYLVLHRKVIFEKKHAITLPPNSDLESMLRWVLGRAVYEDEELVAWELRTRNDKTGNEE